MSKAAVYDFITKETTIVDLPDEEITEQPIVIQPTVEELQQQIIELQEQVILLLGV